MSDLTDEDKDEHIFKLIADNAELRARHEKLREFLRTADCHNGEYEWHQRDNSLCGWCNRRNALLEDE